MMRAITVTEYGATPALTEMPDPQPGSGKLLIRTEAAGVNPMDRAIADGGWKELMPASFPLILGADLAGVIEAVGEGAVRFQPGDAVFGQLLIPPLGSTGTYAEYVAVTEDAPLARVPRGLDPGIAAAIPTAGITALEIVESVAPLSGKTVLMVGAAGGIGSYATQLAANNGAQVIAVARAGAEDRMRAYGAAETIDHTTASVPDTVRRTHPDGIDVLIDVANDADSFATLAGLVRPGGTAVTTRYVADTDALASREVTGVNFQVSMSSEALGRLAEAVVEGSIVMPPITRVKLDDVLAPNGSAHAEGKTVITF
jgi:NADPH2:quinone reductase